jgi:hypothetical protein
MLTRPDRVDGVARVQPKKPRKHKKKSKDAISKRIYQVRPKCAVKWSGVRMKTVGWEKGKRNGMKFHYNFRMEQELGHRFAYRRIPCSCEGCFQKLQEPLATRYTGKCDTCYLWKIFEKKDGSGEGLNDWRLGQFEEAKDNSQTEYHAQKADTLQLLGETYSKEVEDGNVAAYSTNSKKYDG